MADYLFIAACVAVIASLFTIPRWPGWFRALRSANWPLAEGRIENGDVRVLPGEGRETALARLGYSFSVEGEYCAGYCLEKMFDSSMSARKYIAESKGTKIFVHYDPRNPNRSVRRKLDQSAVAGGN